MTPEQLLDPETLPDDLRWLGAEFRLSPKDPVFLLIAWHWHRVQEAEDSLRVATVEFQSTVDKRGKDVAAAVNMIASLRESLSQVETAWQEQPALIKQQWDTELAAALKKLQEAQQAMDQMVSSARDIVGKARSREILAAVLIGIGIGALGAFLAFMP